MTPRDLLFKKSMEKEREDDNGEDEDDDAGDEDVLNKRLRTVWSMIEDGPDSCSIAKQGSYPTAKADQYDDQLVEYYKEK